MADPILTFTWTKDGDQVQTNVTITGGTGMAGIDGETIPIGTDAEVVIAIDASALKAIYVLSTTDATLKANSSTEEDFTLTLTGGKPLVWCEGCGMANPITDDVTVFYVTNAAETVLTIRTAQDPTP